MAIYYDLYPNSGILADTSYHPRPVKGTTVCSDELSEHIARRTTLPPADMKAAMSALAESIVEALSAGHRVHVEASVSFPYRWAGTYRKSVRANRN